MTKKIKTFAEVGRLVAAARKEGKIVVATNGCFDILHVGHVRNLEATKALGDVLVVGVNSDASVRLSKGSKRPIVPARERAEIVASLEAVDHVFIFSGRTPFSWIKKLKPHIHTKGGGEDIISHPDIEKQREAVEAGGGTLVFVPHHEGRSSTGIMDRIRDLIG